MKTLQVILSILLYSGSICAQNEYYNTLDLKNKLINNILSVNSEVMSILKEYYPLSKLVYDSVQIKKVISNNPFFANIEIRIIKNDTIMSRGGIERTISKLGGIDVTAFSQGLSLFLIERAKEELNVAFFQRFKDFFEKEATIEISVLFPATTDKIGGLLAYQYPQMLPVLKDAFQRDMVELPENIINVLLLPEHFEEIEKYPELLILLNLYKSLNQLDQISPPQLLEILPPIAKFHEPNIDNLISVQNLYSIFKLSEIISKSVRLQTDNSVENMNYWVSSSDFNQNVLRDPVAQKIYLGLLYERIKDNQLKINGNFVVDLIKKEKIKQEIIWFSNQLAKILEQFNKVDLYTAKISNANGNRIQPEPDDYYACIGTTLGLIEIGLETAEHLDPKIPGNLTWLIKNGNELFRNTYCKDYSLAISNALALLDTLNRTLKGKELIKPGVMKHLYTYGRFIGNVADAENPEDFKAAISAISLPSGSSSVKKYQLNNLSVNAYLGATVLLHTRKESARNTWKNKVGMSVPIGINYSLWPMERYGSLSLFASLLDIGAVVDYQLTDSTNSSFEQKIYLENIVSPGFYVVYGFGDNIPLAFSFGVQFGPGLTKIGNDIKKPTWRWNVTLTVDIPMINLNQGRRKGD